MYKITECWVPKKGKIYFCEVQIQDGTERWEESSKEKAIFSVIKAARILNGNYIKEEDIVVRKLVETLADTSKTITEQKILEDIKRGEKILLDHDDMRVKMHITDEECRMILAWREGEARFTFN